MPLDPSYASKLNFALDNLFEIPHLIDLEHINNFIGELAPRIQQAIKDNPHISSQILTGKISPDHHEYMYKKLTEDQLRNYRILIEIQNIIIKINDENFKNELCQIRQLLNSLKIDKSHINLKGTELYKVVSNIYYDLPRP